MPPTHVLPTRSSWYRGCGLCLRWITLALLGVSLNTGLLHADEAPHWIDSSPLPQGPGFAAEVSSTSKLPEHPAVIFADDFEHEGLGKLWDETSNPGGTVLKLVSDPSPATASGKQYLQVTATLGKNTGGNLTKWFDIQDSDTVFVRYYTWFDPQCDYTHHFCKLRANKSLRGSDKWSGFGQAGTRPVGDERFTTAVEPWGNWGAFTPPGKWNFYSYLHTMKAAPDGNFWGNQFAPKDQPNIERGKWICVEFMLKHNTPGKPDGEQAFWIDGELRGHWGGFNWRKVDTLKVNSFTLESYVTDRWTKNPVNIVSFDNVVVANQYIGPVPTPH